MNVFQGARKGEGACLDFGLHLLEAPDNVRRVRGRNDRAVGQHPGVGNRSGDILGVEAAVEADGGIYLDHDLSGACAETAAPYRVRHRFNL